MLQRDSTVQYRIRFEFGVPHFCFCILPPAAATEAECQSSSSLQTSYWPLCPGRRLSQEAMWQLHKNHCSFKEEGGEKGRFMPEECTSLHDCSRIPHQTLSKGELHYIPHTGREVIETWHPKPVMEILPELNWHAAGGFWGNKQSWDGLSISLLIYL